MRAFGLAVIISACAACAEQSAQTTDGGGRDAIASTEGGPADSGAPKDAQPFDAAAFQGLVINEVSTRGGDWIELYNKGNAAVDLTGLRITDDDKDGGAPRVASATQFADGLKLAPDAYLMVLANQPSASGALGPCFDGGIVSGCTSVTFGISKTAANTIFVLAPDDAPTTTADIPANATMAGQTWGRFPNGTGAFGVTKPTPGAANAQ